MNQTNAQRLTRLKITLALAILCGFLLSPKLWLSTRAYPLTPIAEFLPALAFPLDYLAFALLLLLLIGIVFSARPRKLIVSFVVLVVLVCLCDQTRWQPWCYQYVFMSLALAVCYSWRADDEGGRESALNACAFVVAGIYFWSGLQKVNFAFTEELFPALVAPYVRYLPASFGVASRWVAPLLVPLAEIGVGVGLLSRRFRTHAIILALALHLSVLILFVPVRRNTVIWPWNVAMMCFVVILFWHSQPPMLKQTLTGKGQVLTKLAVLLFWVMPVFNFFGYWDAYLSSSLYSGKTMYGYVEVSAEVKARLPPVAQSYTRARANGQLFVDVTRWSFGELNVPPYPAARVYKNITNKICASATHAPEVALELHEEPRLFSRVRNVKRDECAAH